jgi:hypothetical protein
VTKLGKRADQSAADRRVILHEEELCHRDTLSRNPTRARSHTIVVALASPYLTSCDYGHVTGLRGALTSIAAWTLGVVAAVSVGLVALAMIGSGLTANPVQPLSQDMGDQPPLTAAGSPSSHPSSRPTQPSPTSSAEPRTDDTQRLTTTRGGTVVAKCHGDEAYLLYWSPAQGFAVQEVLRGPARVARVTFKGMGREIKISVSCVANVPQSDIQDDADHDTHD